MSGPTRRDDGFDAWMAARGIKSGLTARRPHRALLAELGMDEPVLDAAKGKIGNGLGYVVVTDTRVIVVGQSVAALSADSMTDTYSHDEIDGVTLYEGKFQSTLSLSTVRGDVTIDNMTSGAQRLAATLRGIGEPAPATTDPDAERRCPYCAETIKAAAIKCRFCGEFL